MDHKHSFSQQHIPWSDCRCADWSGSMLVIYISKLISVWRSSLMCSLGHVHLVETQISPCICIVWSDSFHCLPVISLATRKVLSVDWPDCIDTFVGCICLMVHFLILQLMYIYMSQRMIKATKRHVRPAKTQIRLGIHPVWSESSLCAQWVAKDPKAFFMQTAKTDQTGQMPRLIWVFTGHTCHLVCHALAYIHYNDGYNNSICSWRCCN